jgi:exopolysaccharide biosynthesis polyprenyl glycosylphosphotransferase
MATPVLSAPTAEALVADLELRRLVTATPRARQLHDRGWLVRRALALADVTALLIAFTAAHVGQTSLPFLLSLALFALTLPGWLLGARLYNLYDHDLERVSHSTVDDVGRVFHLLVVGTVLLSVARLTFGIEPSHLHQSAIRFAVFALPLMLVGRASARAFAQRRLEYLQNTIIVGAGDVGQSLARKLLLHPEYGLNLVGFVDSQPKERRDDLQHLVLLGDFDDLPRLVRLLDVERVLIAFSNESHEQVLELIRSLRELGVQVDIIPRLFDLIGPGVHLHSVEGLPLIGLSRMRLSRSSRVLKRSFDVLVAGALLLLLSPAFAIAALCIKLTSRGPVFFKQARQGENGSTFDVYKLRTMVADADDRKHEVAHLNKHAQPGGTGDLRMFKVVNDPRVTGVGRVLRKYFIDELPQLLNVIRGEMSLIGPRPLIHEEANLVDNWGLHRLDLRPGMTGIWQVLGRSDISFAEMVRLDYLYVTTWSLGNDLRILCKTLPVVMRGESPV